MAGKSEREDCIDRIVKAAGGKITRQEAMDALDALLKRAERRGPDWKPIEEKLAEAAAEMQQALVERAAVAGRNARNDALKGVKLDRDMARGSSLAEGLEAKLGGVNTGFEGARLSVDAGFKGRRREIFGRFGAELEAAGVDKLFLSGALEREWAAELHQLNKGAKGHPGVTGSEDALKIAQAIFNGQKRAIGMINAEGGWVKDYFGYIVRTTHDPDRIRRMGKEAWIDLVLKHLDVERTFHTDDAAQARFELGKMWPQFVNGDHFDYSKPFDDSVTLVNLDFAQKASQHRELHFAGSDAWLAYNDAAGRFPPTFAVVHAFENAARLSALMSVFGSQPRKGLEEALHFIRAKTAADPDGRAKLDKYEPLIRNLFAQFDGTAQRPLNRTLATIGANIRAVQRMTKLGLTPFAMLTDLATKASELRYQGMNFAERHGSTIADYFRGATGSEKREVATLLGHAIESEIGAIAQHFDGEGQTAGGKVTEFIRRAEQRFFRITGIQAMTFNQRHAAERIMAAHLGGLRGKAFAELGTAEARILRQFEIGKLEWELLQKVGWNEIEGTTYFTPEIATRLSDVDMRAYLIETGRLNKNAGIDTVKHVIDKARDDLGLKLASYFADRGEFAVLEPGARERAVLFGGVARDWAPGSKKGEAWRLFLQFKAFPATMLMKTWSRELYGGQGTAEKIAGLTELIVYSTMLGIVAGGLNQIVKGQDPISKWRNDPASALLAGFIRGGAASIYGDFLLGEWSRHGMQLLDTLAGPTFGQIDRVAEMWSDLRHRQAGKKTAMIGWRLARDNLAIYGNMIWTKYTVDALIYWRFAEWLSPGFLERHERTMKQKQGIEYLDWLRPTRVAR